MIDYAKLLPRLMNLGSVRSFAGGTAAVVLITALVFIASIQTPAQQAFGDILVFIQDQQSCEESPINGHWSADTNTCTLFSGLILDEDYDVEVVSGVTVILPNSTQSVVGSGRALSIAGGAILEIEGESINGGTISNSGILTVSNPYANSIGIFSNGTITNSGNMTVSNADANNKGILNLGIVNNSGSLTVANTGDFGIFSSGTIDNSGTITLSNSDGFAIDNEGIFNNSGSVIVSQYSSLNSMYNTGIIMNFGNMTVENSDILASDIVNAFGGTIANFGNIIIENSEGNGIANTFVSSFTNAGTITVSNTGGNGIANTLASSFTNTGTITVNQSVQGSFGIYNEDIMNNEAFVNNSGSIFNSGTINNFAIINNLNGGNITNQDTGTINNYAVGLITNEGNLVNIGLLLQNGTLNSFGTLTTSGQIENWGSSSNSGTLSIINVAFSSSGIDNFGNLVNSGTLYVSNGGSSIFGIHNLGTLTNSGLLLTSNGEGNVGIFNSATGSIVNSLPGTLHVSGLSQGSVGIENSGILSNSATIIVTNAGFASLGIVNSVGGTLNNTGIVTVSNGQDTSYGISNAGTINNEITGGLYNNGSILNDNLINNYGAIGSSNFVNNTGTTYVYSGGTFSSDPSGVLLILGDGIFSVLCGGSFNDNGGAVIGTITFELCDADADGISDDVDTQPNTFSNDFSDTGIGGTTVGTIITRGNQTITLMDAPNPEGVSIETDPSGGSGSSAQVTACGGSAIFTLSASTDIIVTCGSITTQVVQGPVEAEFFGSDGSTASATIAEGNTLTFDPDTFSFTADPDNKSPVEVSIGENTVTVSPGDIIQRLDVTIDIKPGGTPNTINIKKDSIVTVALLGGSTFSVDSVDASTIRFGGHTLQPSIRTSLQDVNADSYIDIVVQFEALALGFEVSDTEGCLTGLLQDGTPIMGCDSVRILSK